jgi:hypothetical protein
VHERRKPPRTTAVDIGREGGERCGRREGSEGERSRQRAGAQDEGQGERGASETLVSGWSVSATATVAPDASHKQVTGAKRRALMQKNHSAAATLTASGPESTLAVMSLSPTATDADKIATATSVATRGQPLATDSSAANLGCCMPAGWQVVRPSCVILTTLPGTPEG